MAGAYVFLMSISGSIIVFRNELARGFPSIEWLVKLHANLALGPTGKIANGVGGILRDNAVFDRSGHLVAGNEELASQSSDRPGEHGSRP